MNRTEVKATRFTPSEWSMCAMASKMCGLKPGTAMRRVFLAWASGVLDEQMRSPGGVEPRTERLTGAPAARDTDDI